MRQRRRRVGLTAVTMAAALAAVPATAATGAAPEDAEPTAPNLVANPGFEDLDEEGWPASWHPMWASSVEAFSVDDAEASEGERSVRVLDENPARGFALRSDAVAVDEGATYRLALDVKLSSGTLQPSVIFLDEAEARVSIEYERVAPAAGSWSRQEFTATVPDGATQAQVLIDTTVAGVTDGWVDDVSFTRSDAGEPDDAPGLEENLGEPVAGLTNAGAGYTQDADGRDIGLVVAGGSPSRFSAVDLVTGERLMTETITASTLTWAYATTPDRSVYVATASGEVYRFDPDAITLTRVANQPFGETYFWEGQANADGEVFFATYPNGKLLRYAPTTDEWTDFGTLVEGNSYVRSLAVDGTDVYAGGGTADPVVVHVDTVTEEQRRIELPEEYRDQEFVYDTSVAHDTLFVRTTPANEILVYSLTDEAWVDTIPDAVGLEVSPPVQTLDSGTERTEVLIPKIGGGMIGYDLDTREQRTVSLDLGGASARGWSLQEVDLEGFPGESLVTATSKAVFHVWNPQTGQTRSVRSDASPTPFLLRSLGTGPEGDVWAGGYASPPGVARVDADTGESTLLAGPGQVEGMVAHGDDMVIGTYPGSRIYVYDTAEPWENGTNPPAPLTIGHGQDRPVAWASAGDVVAIGSVPDYGHLGGALTLLDTDTGEMTVHEHLIEDQTVISLAYRDGLIYGGTGIWGGLGTDPSTAEGQLFIFDPDTEEILFQGVPVPGEENVSGLAFAPDGQLWGMTANEVFRFDPETREVVERQRYFDVDDSAAYWTTRELFWHEDRLVGQTASTLFEIDPDTLEMTRIQTGVQNLAIDRLGSYYYNRGGVLYRWVPDTEEPEQPTVVTPEAVVFTDEDGTENDSYTVPSVDGVSYLLDGEAIPAGTHPGAGTVTITAAALEGYELAPDAVTEWNHTFSTEGGEPAPGPDPGPDPKPSGPLEFHLSNTWRGTTDVFFMYGRVTDEVFIGDWDGDGHDTIAVRRGDVFHVSNGHRGGDADEVFTYGRPGDTVLVGDWDGDGTDTFAVRRGKEYHVKNALHGGEADHVIRYGREDDDVMVGDWNGDGRDTFAVRRGSEYHVKSAIAGGAADRVFRYGRAGDVVLAGDWNGDGKDTFAVRRGKEYHVKNSLRGGDADVVTFFGHPDDHVITGDWDANGTDTLGIHRPVNAD